MRLRQSGWIFGALVAIALSILWFAIPRARLPGSPQGEPKASVRREEPTPRTPQVRSAATPRLEKQPVVSPTQAMIDALPDWKMPLDQAVTQLQMLAEAGNSLALRELTYRLKVCTPHALREALKSDERDRESIEEDTHDEHLDEALRATRISNTQRRIDTNATFRSDCSKVPPDLTANWLDPMDQAAQSGDTSAMRDYAKLAIAEYDSVAAIVADIDTAIVRRDKARAYLQRALQLGDREVLLDLADAYFEARDATPRLYAPDAFQAYAYAYAGLQAGTPQRGNSLDWIVNQSAQSLNAQQLSAAQAKAVQIYEACCHP